MTEPHNKWILMGSLGTVFAVTLIFSYGPGYGGSLLSFISKGVSISPQMSPNSMVTPLVTSKKLVTLSRVTNVTSVSPSVSPTTSTEPSPVDADYSLVTSSPSHTPTVTPTPLVTSPLSPQPKASLSPTPTPYLTSQPQTTVSALATPAPTPTAPQSTKININTADLIGLDAIPGVGLVIGQKIIDYRIANGPFQKIEDIIGVKGIGDATFQKMKDQITVGP